MGILSVSFIFCFFILGVTSGCRVFAPNLIDPHCGVAKDCYYNGQNIFKTNNESCRREKLNKDGFSTVIRGKCPLDKPPC
ncbi:accessory gland protein Acp63F [Drosophila serrata]|uniref:accessory gland protein Acp63F n=1 Tax=Drosophila serrata TaxID=7274 RepID=UPI000A1D0CE2|nr:accessory gland protein Acp63F [Drosophila serrata]